MARATMDADNGRNEREVTVDMQQMARRVVVTVLGVSLWIMTGHASAGASGTYDAGDKLTRGLSNLFLGVLEVPRGIHTVSEDHGLFTGWTVGLGQGAGHTVQRMLVGLFEIVTFPFELPKHYEPIVKPEYVWEGEGPPVIE